MIKEIADECDKAPAAGVKFSLYQNAFFFIF